MTYTLSASSAFVIRDSDQAFIPVDAANADYRVYLEWVSAGNTANPYISPPPGVPDSISDRQFFQQAALQGVITQADALAAVQTGTIPALLSSIVNGISDPTQQFGAKMLLSGAVAFQRHHPLTEAIGSDLGWTDAQIDAFFIAAAAL